MTPHIVQPEHAKKFYELRYLIAIAFKTLFLLQVLRKVL